MSEPQAPDNPPVVEPADAVGSSEPLSRFSRSWVGATVAVLSALAAGILSAVLNQTVWVTVVLIAIPVLIYIAKVVLDRYRRKRTTKVVAFTVLIALGALLAVLVDRSSDQIIVCDFCPKLVTVPAGSFDMGSPTRELGRFPSEGPVRRVTIDYQLDVGVYEVTVGQFRRFVEESKHRGHGPCWVLEGWDWRNWTERQDRDWQDPGFAQSDAHPVTCVSWYDAGAYVEWLSNKTGQTWRLLSEAEWEYVARAGTTSSRFWGDSALAQCDYANGADQSTELALRAPCQDRHAQTSPVGSYKENAFGLYDVLGNVSEWTADCWRGSYDGAPSNGSARLSRPCERRVIRSGSRYMPPQGLRSAHRDKHAPHVRNHSTGFRVARERTGSMEHDEG